MATAERSLVSAVLISKDMTQLVKANFSSDVMIRHAPELMYIEKAGRVPSLSTFKSKFPDFKMLRVAEEDIPLLIKQCEDNRIRFELTKQIKKTVNRLDDDEVDIRDVSGKFEEQVRFVNLKYGVSKDVDVMESYNEIVNTYSDRRKLVKAGETIGVPFGIPALDEHIGGMMPSDMITIAARSGNMKTWFLAYLVANALLADRKVLFLSLEMPKEQITYRVWTILSRLMQKGKVNEKLILKNDALNLGKMDSKKVARFAKYFRDKIKGSLIFPETKGKFAIEHTAYKIEQHKADIVFFDYFGLAVSTKGGADNWMEAKKASNSCKAMAITYNIPFILASQINRQGAESMPKLSQIAITDSIGQDSDRVFMLQRKNQDLTILQCAKNRLGVDNFRVYLDTDINKGLIKQRMVSLDRGDEEEE